MAFDGRIYGADEAGANASVGSNTQINPAYFFKKALIELVKERNFGNLADVRAMPKNMGKTIKQHHYLPLLDDENVNDQGIDAAGAVINQEYTITVYRPDAGGDVFGDATYNRQDPMFFVGNGTTATLAVTAAKAKFIAWAASPVSAGGLNAVITTPGTTAADFTTLTSTGGAFDSGQATFDSGYRVTDQLGSDDTAVAANTSTGTVMQSGNLYGSSKDVGYIAARLPALSETGGRVNRVGFKRKTLQATIDKFGFFDEYTQESMDFDTDADLMMHITRETLRGANEITEDMLQIDLLQSAGIVRYAGTATQSSDIQGNDATNPFAADNTNDIVTYEDLMKLGIDLDNNRCPKTTKLISGSRMIDTKTIDAARYMYVGSELIPTLKAMVDLHGNPAFIDIRHYSDAGNTVANEIGSIDQFRIVVVPEMMKFEGGSTGGGASVTTNGGFYETNGAFDVFPMLVVGSGSFTTIGFQTAGKTVKFSIKHAKPGSTESYANDPYGETGFYSIKWYYGFMVLRPEWLAVIKTVAQY